MVYGVVQNRLVSTTNSYKISKQTIRKYIDGVQALALSDISNFFLEGRIVCDSCSTHPRTMNVWSLQMPYHSGVQSAALYASFVITYVHKDSNMLLTIQMLHPYSLQDDLHSEANTSIVQISIS